MPKKLIETFSVEWLQILDEDGNCDEELRPSLDNEQVKKLYESMVLARTFDEKAASAPTLPSSDRKRPRSAAPTRSDRRTGCFPHSENQAHHLCAACPCG